MNITTIKQDDILLITVPVGNMPPNRAKEYMETVKQGFALNFTNTLMVLPTKGGEYKVEILRKE